MKNTDKTLSERKIFGERIRLLRKNKGWSQEKLAEKANLNTKYMGIIERNEKSPTLHTIISISKALNIPTKELFLTPYKTKSLKDDHIHEASGSYTPKDKILNEIISNLSNKKLSTLKKILNIIKILDA